MTFVPTIKTQIKSVDSILTGANLGTKNGSTVAVAEYGTGYGHTTVFTLTSTPVTVANVTGASFGGLKLYDFPEGRIMIVGGTASFSFDWSASDIGAAGSGDFSLGTTISADATLGGTDVDIMASTAMLDPFVSGVGTGSGALVNNTAFDGTGTAKDLNLNIIIDDADVADAASDIVYVTGTITVKWDFLGDI
jgi:hypothetical protein